MKELLIIQSRLKAPKSQFNKFGNFPYRNCEDILEAVKPLLKETKTVLVLSDDIAYHGDRHYVRAEASLHSEDGKLILKVFAYARESEEKKGMDSAQITGAASSYARKYALNGLFCIDDTKDADTPMVDKPDTKPDTKPQEPEKPHEPEKKERNPLLASDDQQKEIRRLAKINKVDDFVKFINFVKAKYPDYFIDGFISKIGGMWLVNEFNGVLVEYNAEKSLT